MMTMDGIVFVVDDDPLIRDALRQLIKSVGLETCIFASAKKFLDMDPPKRPSCLVLDIRMPVMGGLDLQEELIRRGLPIPVIFITGHGTVPLSVRAMKAGAVDFIQKPFEDQDLLDAIHKALAKDKKIRIEQAEIRVAKQRIESLTPREHEVLVLVFHGKLNKQIAYELNISENTVKSHRASIMKKMMVNSLADLIRLTEKAGIGPTKG